MMRYSVRGSLEKRKYTGITVSELIKKLKAYPQNLPTTIEFYNHCCQQERCYCGDEERNTDELIIYNRENRVTIKI